VSSRRARRPARRPRPRSTPCTGVSDPSPWGPSRLLQPWSLPSRSPLSGAAERP